MSITVWLMLLTNISCWMTRAQKRTCVPACAITPNKPGHVECHVSRGVVGIDKPLYDMLKPGECRVAIDAGVGNRVLLDFTLFDMELLNCHDHVVLYDGRSTKLTGKHRQQLCARRGTITTGGNGNGIPSGNPFRSSGQYFALQFITNPTLTPGQGLVANISPFPMNPTVEVDTVYYVDDTIVLTCRTYSAEADEFDFYRDGTLLDTRASTAYTVTHTATIGTHDKTYYRCRASITEHSVNGRSGLSDPVRVVVRPKPAKLVAVPLAATIESGKDVEFTCATDTKSRHLTYRFYQGDDVKAAVGKTLTINAVVDSGTYTCEAVISGVSSGKSNEIKVRIVDKPGIPDLTVEPSQPTDGETMTLNCKTTTDEITCFEFKYHTTSITTDIISKGTSTIGKYIIDNATIKAQNGNYSCIAFIDTVKSEESAKLEVLLKPKTPTLINTVPVGYWVENGTMENFTCHTDSLGPDIEYRILRDETEVFRKEDGKYVIHSAETNDTGNYTCQAKIENSTWSKPSKKCSMTVINKPRQPELTVHPSGPNFQHGDQLNFTCKSLTHGYDFDHLFFNYSDPISDRKPVWYSVNTSLENIDTYEYTCKVVINGVESKNSNPINFAVMPRTPTLTVSPTESTIESGSKLRLTCTTQSTGDIDYFYLQDDQIVFHGKDDQNHTIDTSTSHSGKYSCKVRINEVDSLKSNVHSKEVVDKPITRLITDVESPTFGDEVLLRCGTSSNRITRFDFKRNQDILASGKSNILQIDLDTIDRDEATYLCLAYIDTVSSDPSPGVNISYVPPGMSVYPPDQICRCLDQATLSCDASSKTVKTYMFFRDGIEVYNGPDKYHHVLTKDNKAGVYSCKVQVKGQRSPPSKTYKLIDCASARSPCGSGEHTCKENDLGYTCDCEIGYKLNNKSTPGCDDIDECQSPDKICQLAGIEHTCENTIGSYRCVCRDGYENVDVKGTACDETIQEPGKPDVDLLKMESIGVLGFVGALSTYIIIFGVTVIVLDIRLVLSVLYRLCTTEAVLYDDSDSEEDSDEDSDEDLPANQDNADDKVPDDPINDAPLTNTVHNPSTDDFLNIATRSRHSSWTSEDNMTLTYQGENANIWGARGSVVWTQPQMLPSWAPSRAESEDQMSNSSISWSSIESLSETNPSESSLTNTSM